ncbi:MULTISPECIES: FAD-dependent oxidoreductase [unclassified Nocardiopsis]|uniref:FAD-dependent oxidoreductase n=1 Tax=Nocardiopsis TaxID=2013 RepID=UPI00387A9810
MTEERTYSVAIVGAGPVGCALATLLRGQGIDVDLFERTSESGPVGSGHSFNLTLTSRGVSALPHGVKRRLYHRGTVLTKRIIHHRNGAISTQPYGTSDTHHLLSIPRRDLQDLLRDQAVRAGARIHYERECVGVDADRAAVTVRARDGHTTRHEADLLVGCDGANSAVRDAISPEHLRVTHRSIAHGHAEITMDYGDADPSGLHLWPRGDHFLQAQPNPDRTFTTSLFKPMTGSGRRSHFAGLDSAEAVRDYCSTEFPDVFDRMSRVDSGLLARLPTRLRTVDCAPYHRGRTVLVGDAAHTVVPFYGQGVNCSFEDAATLAALLEKFRFAHGSEARAASELVAREYSDARVEAGHALAELSLDNLAELSAHVDDSAFLARRSLERRLHQEHPELYMPLYQLVAFTSLPYNEARRMYRETNAVLDALCAGRDLYRDREQIIGQFARVREGGLSLSGTAA